MYEKTRNILMSDEVVSLLSLSFFSVCIAGLYFLNSLCVYTHTHYTYIYTSIIHDVIIFV